MSKHYKNKDSSESKAIEDFVTRMNKEYRILVILKAQLYGGHWKAMLKDLRKRLAGKPFVFKLPNIISEDIKRIEEMQEFEKVHNVDLAEYIEEASISRKITFKAREGERSIQPQQYVQLEKLLIQAYIKKTVTEDDIVKNIVELFEGLNKYDILSGGRGLTIDDWATFVTQTQLSGVS
jgi:hypothetical protein